MSDFAEKDAIVAFSNEELEKKHLKKVRPELFKLTIIYFGYVPPRGVYFIKLSAMYTREQTLTWGRDRWNKHFLLNSGLDENDWLKSYKDFKCIGEKFVIREWQGN